MYYMRRCETHALSRSLSLCTESICTLSVCLVLALTIIAEFQVIAKREGARRENRSYVVHRVAQTLVRQGVEVRDRWQIHERKLRVKWIESDS